MKAKVNFDGQWLSDIEIHINRYQMNYRLKKSLKTFFIFLGAALLSVLIPVLHFFLVPLLLILAFALSYRKFKEIISVDLHEINCPECKTYFKETTVALKENDLIIRLNCEKCRKNLTIILEESFDEI